ncbi:MAG TPA: MBL fold metallo-hydrolase [Aggregatilinea sp.]|jgi:ribonuclease Z|uniref:MBL fold metallo-hydrolase n=1 Tax=Aggregatilinea sp. TaxID=2806333 RepID=UPI002CE027D3|nr:MBL fold metallo-hydrolase [Aggregatilinea sp.]HML22903.1 MBL fold metallo-hydrolase [Aggregatilinea sp.]
MFEIVFLGTSASAPSVHRGLSAQVVMVKDHRYLVDCGEGTQRQILKSGIGFKRLNRILLTHGHLDHILGLAGLMSTFMRWESIESLEIWGGRATLDRVQELLFGVVLRGAKPPMPLHLIDVKPGVLMEDADYSVSAFPVKHRGRDNYGYVFQEKSRRPFLVEKAEALGVPAGPERARLVRGEAVHLSDGRVIEPDAVLGPDLPGARLVITGDVATFDGLEPIVQGAHALVTEATYTDEDAEMADAFGHMTAGRAARFAADMGVGTLLLTHVSRRYRERDVLDDARRFFPNSFVVRDFDRFAIAKDRPVSRVERSDGEG